MEIKNGFTGKTITVADGTSAELIDYVHLLEKRVLRDKQYIKELKETIELMPKTAGRTQKLSLEQKRNIATLRKAGVPLIEIAAHYNCSVALISKITKDINVDLRRKDSPKVHIRKNS